MVSGDEEVPPFASLELRNVSFTYDFSDKPRYEFHDADHKMPETESGRGDALRHVDLTLRRGEKIAIVGYNGAGKTTLIKLLMRLYDPTEGLVLWNGRDLREYDTEQLRGRIGTVFQDFKIFAASVGENVMGGRYDPESDEETVRTALDAAGFTEKLRELERGIDTTLTREFDDHGTNLSGGEAQKVAIARVFAKPFELIIMDEPSSALDPVAEYELNQAILRYAADKTVIFISHRLSTTRMADRIYMFDSGALCEVGSHDELMKRDGKYAEMFRLQAEKYREE
jgi:ATP-binding cassette subfamily B protein